MKRSNSARAGFMLSQVALVVLLFALPVACGRREHRATKLEMDIANYKTMLLMYEGANGLLPTTEQGLKALIAPPEIEPKPRHWRQFMDVPIRDPWQHEYFYENPGKHNPTAYDLYSAGPDGVPGTKDDVGNWDKVE